MTEPLGAVLIGAGSIGELRARALRRSPHFRLEAVADVQLEAARRVAGGSARACQGWREALGLPGVEIAVVSTPPDQHAEITEAALASGLHVLCEKPLANSVEAARRMCEVAEAEGRVLKTGFNHRYFPAVAFARRLIESGRIGRVIRVRARAGHPGGKEFGHQWVHDGAVTGGGAMVDNGIHILDLVRFFVGEVRAAHGYVANHLWSFETAEDTGLGLFRGDGGALASVEASWCEWRGYRFSVEAIGSRGFVRASYPPMLAEWGVGAEPGTRVRRRFEMFPWFQLRERIGSWRWTIVRSFVEELEGLAVAVRTGVEVPPTGRDGLRALEMAAAVYRSDSRGTELPPDE